MLPESPLVSKARKQIHDASSGIETSEGVGGVVRNRGPSRLVAWAPSGAMPLPRETGGPAAPHLGGCPARPRHCGGE